jgi:hypothetical protein
MLVEQVAQGAPVPFATVVEGIVERLLNWLCLHPDNPLRKFMLGYYVVDLLGALAGVGLAVAGVHVVYVFLALLPLLTSPVVVPIMAVISTPYVRSAQQIRRGDHLAHWQYLGDEWVRFGQYKAGENLRLMKLSPVFAAVLGLVTGGIAWSASRDVRTFLAMFGILLGVGLLAALQFWFEARAHGQGVNGARSDVYISHDGVLRPQGYLPISAFNVRLVDVVVEQESTGVTVMRFKVGSLTEDLVKRVSEFEIPVPDGRAGEASGVAQRLLQHAQG